MLIPAYFNPASHVWIAYVLLLNGLLLSQVICRYSGQYQQLVATFEARVLSGFFLSLLVNGSIIFLFSLFGLDFTAGRFLLPCTSGLLLLFLFFSRQTGSRKSLRLLPEFGWLRFFFYLSVFIVLLFNGGLIEQLADSWWHMSLANKIGWYGSLDATDHLSGVARRYYPPLWHGNLALLQDISGIPLPVLWNSFTAWGAVFKVMAFYLFGLGLTGNAGIALLGASLFVLLPGLGDTYLRVSAWPSHVAYAAWFSMYYLVFRMFDWNRNDGEDMFDTGSNGLAGPFHVSSWLRQNRAAWISLFLLAVIVFFVHLVELVWFAGSLLAYAMVLAVYKALTYRDVEGIEPGGRLLNGYLLCGLAALLGVTTWRYLPVLAGTSSLTDPHLAVILIMAGCLTFLYLVAADSSLQKVYNRRIVLVLLGLLAISVLLSIDFRQAASLFKPELGYSIPRHHENPLTATGWLGGELALPGWHLQLRPGLLYAGVAGMGAAIFLMLVRPGRTTLFLGANALAASLFLVSPYLYQWLLDILGYKSPWRIGLLIFHPLILAVFVYYLWGMIVSGAAGRAEKRLKIISASLVLFLLAAIIVTDGLFHFNPEVVEAKRKNASPQRHWGIGDMQRYIYRDSSIRYQEDFARMAKAIEPGYAILSDLPTSYYAAAELPVYVINLHRHHDARRAGARKFYRAMLNLCYLEDAYHRQAFQQFLRQDRKKAIANGWPPLRYVLLNKDKGNSLLHDQCIAMRSDQLEVTLLKIGQLLYEGEHLNLYRLNDSMEGDEGGRESG